MGPFTGEWILKMQRQSQILKLSIDLTGLKSEVNIYSQAGWPVN
jgi:hypothetical protein